MAESRHLSQTIARSAAAVYEYASDPANLPEWASGLGSSVEHVDGQWFVDSPDGRLTVVFAERNDYGILDHDVTLPSGETVHNPMRVIADGDGCAARAHLATSVRAWRSRRRHDSAGGEAGRSTMVGDSPGAEP